MPQPECTILRYDETTSKVYFSRLASPPPPPPPPPGGRTLYFVFREGISDGEWTNLDNWSLDSMGVSSVGELPTSIDNVIIQFGVTSNSGEEPIVANLTVLLGGLNIDITVNGTAVFEGTMQSNSTITGNATFTDNSFNDSNSTIIGNATFTDNAYNQGNVTGTATFSGNACNLGGTAGTFIPSPPPECMAPGSDMSLSVQRLANYNLTIGWSIPSSSGSSAITEYEIEYDGGAGIQYVEITDPTQLTYSLNASGYAGVEVEFRVRAINLFGPGSWSEPAYGTPADVPSEATYLYAQTSMSTNGAIEINGVIPPADNHSDITSFDVQLSLTDDFSSPIKEETFVYNGTDAYTSGTVSGLAGDTLHYIRIRFTNAIGNGNWSSSFTATSSDTVPGQVTGFSVTPDYSGGGTGVYEWDFAWTEPYDGGSTILSYEIEEAALSNNFSGATVFQTLGAGTSTHSASASDRDQDRYFRIRAVNALGNGPWSDVQAAYYETPTSPGAPVINSAYWNGAETVINYSVPDDGGLSITEYTIFFDNVEVSPDNQGAAQFIFNNNYQSSSVTMTVTNELGESPASSAVNVLSVPESPGSVLAEWNGSSTVVTYNEPFDGGSAITGYVFKFNNMQVNPSSVSAGTATFSGFDGSGTDLEVAATNEFGIGPFSSPVTVADNS